MPFFYPAASCTLKVRWEDYARDTDPSDKGEAIFQHLQPVSFVIENNGIRTADKITKLTFQGRDFPFDPRLAREVEVAVYIGKRENGRAPYRPKEPIRASDPVASDPGDLRFSGFLDDLHRERDEKGEFVTFEGRDYTSIFLDAQYPLARLILQEDLKSTIEDMVKGYSMTDLRRRPELRGVPNDVLENIAIGLPAAKNLMPPVIEPGAAAHALQTSGLIVNGEAHTFGLSKDLQLTKPIGHRGMEQSPIPLGKMMSKPQQVSGQPVPVGHNYWDVIQDLCDQLGLVAFIYGDKLVISPPRNLSMRAAQQAPALIWGQNIERLVVKKHLGRLRGVNVQLICHVPGKAKPLSAIWPPKPIPYAVEQAESRSGGNVAGGGGLQQQVRIERYYVSGINSVAALTARAQRIYEERVHNEIELEVETRDMESDSPDSTTVDMTRVRDGTPVGIRVAPELQSVLTHHPPAAGADILVRKGYRRDVAVALAQNWQALKKFSNVFRCKTARHEWDAKKGYSLKLELMNYLNVGDLPDGFVGK